MAINTPSALQLAVGSFLDRSDLTSLIPDFIELAQARFNREIRTPQMLTRSDLATIDSRYEDVPTGWLETVRYAITSDPPVQLEYLTPEEMDNRRERLNDSAKPCYFSVVADQFEFLPTPGDTYSASHLYYTALDLTTTNWLLTSHPDVCLFGALVEAEPYVMNDERMPMWKSKLDEALQSLRKSGDRRAVAGTPKPRIRSF